MNKQIITITFCAVFFAAMGGRSQGKTTEEQVDSIVAILPQLQGKERINALADIAVLTEGYAMEKHYIWLLVKEARKQKDVEREVWALTNLVGVYYAQIDSDSIFIVSEEAIRLARQHGLYSHLFFVKHQLIRHYQKEGKILTAIRTAEEAYQEAKELRDHESIARILAAISHLYYDLYQLEEAVRYRLQSIEEAEKDRDSNAMIFAENYDFLCNMTRYLNLPHETIRYADSMHTEIIRLHSQVQRHYFSVHYHRAIAYAKMKQPNLALQAIRQAEELLSPQWSNKYIEVQVDDMYGEYYFAMGNYDKAVEHISRLADYYKETNITNGIYLAKNQLVEIYAAKGDYKTAYELQSQIRHMNDTLNRNRFYAQINELRTFFQLDKVERESELKTAAIRQQRMFIIGLTFACLGLILIVLLVIWSRKKIAQKNKGLYLQIKEQDRLEEELKQLKSLAQTDSYPSSQHEHEHENTNTKQQQLVAKLHQYLLCDKKFTNFDIEYTDIVAALATNKTYLFDAVKTITGKTVQEYINYLRLDEAKKLLDSNPQHTIEAIAMDCGFNTARTFYRLFKKRYNLTPAEYGKMGLKKNN